MYQSQQQGLKSQVGMFCIFLLILFEKKNYLSKSDVFDDNFNHLCVAAIKLHFYIVNTQHDSCVFNLNGTDVVFL